MTESHNTPQPQEGIWNQLLTVELVDHSISGPPGTKEVAAAQTMTPNVGMKGAIVMIQGAAMPQWPSIITTLVIPDEDLFIKVQGRVEAGAVTGIESYQDLLQLPLKSLQ